MSAKEDQKKIIENTIRDLSNDISMHQWAISHHEKRIEASRQSIHLLKEELAKRDDGVNVNKTTASEIASIKQRMLDALDSIDSDNYANAKISISSALTQFGILMNQLELEMSELRQSARKPQ